MKYTITGLIVFIVILMSIIVLQNNELEATRECKAEAEAWRNATIAQADEFYFWLARNQEPALDHGVSQNFITQAYELQCIDIQLPPG